MGKRSDFPRMKNDLYDTPPEAVEALLPFLDGKAFYEPCCGNHKLIDELEKYGHTCLGFSDKELDATTTKYSQISDIDYFITNPPWTRAILHPLILNLAVQNQKPTWLLFDADWMHTKQASPYLKYCQLIVSIGRVKWIPDSKYTGKDNACWYLFQDIIGLDTEFKGR